MDIKEIEKEISTLNDAKKGLEYKIWQLERQLENEQKDSLKCLVGLAFWSDYDNQGFIVTDTPHLQMSKFRGSYIDPYSIPVLYFNGEDMELIIKQANSKAIDKDNVIETFIKEREASGYRQIPANEFIENVNMLLRKYIAKLVFDE